MEPRVEIVNIVATIKLDPMPDPNEILEKIPGSKPVKRFRGAMLRIGKTPALFYKKKIIVTGVKNTEELEDVIKKLVGILHRYCVKAEPKDYEIVNVTAKIELNRKINLVEAAEKLNGIYDPDYRPYLTVRTSGSTLIISQNGKLVLLNSSNIEEAKRIIKRILELVNPMST